MTAAPPQKVRNRPVLASRMAVGHRVGDVSRTGVTGLGGGHHSKRDQMSV